MLILGIESSCDDMAVAVVKDGRYILSNIVSSQDAIHHKYGGIVPELASRRHLETVIPVIEEALNQAKATLDDIEAIGVTQGPGLVGSILVGLSFAKAVSYVKDIPFVGVNHITAHPMAAFLTPPAPPLTKGGRGGVGLQGPKAQRWQVLSDSEKTGWYLLRRIKSQSRRSRMSGYRFIKFMLHLPVH